MALKLSSKPMYIATAHIWDEEFGERVLKHKERRKDAWTLVEEEKSLSKIEVTGKVVLIDCLTLWGVNFISEKENFNVDEVLKTLKDELSLFTYQDPTFIFVTNEIGMGGVSINPLQRKFTDLLGWLNQWVASISDEVILMVSGIPVKIK